MIRFVAGDIFAVAPVMDAIVNPVNCVGVMGKGLALEFKGRYPQNFVAYKAHCDAGMMEPGFLFCYEQLDKPQWIVNFATKDHWRDPSKMEWLSSGLEQLCQWMIDNNIRRIAIPALGAGLGELPWRDVKVQISESLKDLKADILVFEPR